MKEQEKNRIRVQETDNSKSLIIQKSKTSTHYLRLPNRSIKLISKKLQQNRVKNMTTNKVRSEKSIKSLRGKESFFKKARDAFPPFLRSPWITDRVDSPGACAAVKRIPANAKAIDQESRSSSTAPTIYLQTRFLQREEDGVLVLAATRSKRNGV